jgi:hypothetical protein
MQKHWLSSSCLLATLLATACAAEGVVTGPVGEGDVGDSTPLEAADDSVAASDEQQTLLLAAAPGENMRVCNATALNQRSGPGTSYAILRSMPSGTTVKVVETSGTWIKNDWSGKIGWSSGTYLCKVDGGGGSEPPASFEVSGVSRANIISVAKASVGFSYFWGGGRFATGAAHGACYGSCPNCSHSGSYGADCSGLVGKAWLLPESLPMDSNKHPYSTDSFYNGSTHWSGVSRSNVIQGDALVYRSGGAGHIVIYDKADPWGQMWMYEARGCSYGVIHDLRSLSSSYKGIRRDGL